MKKINKNSSSLNWLGRWIDDNGKYSGWGGSSLQFKFTGTSLSIEIDVRNSGVVVAMIDDYSDDWTHIIPIKSGINIVNIVSNIENKEHTAFLRFASNNYKEKREGNDYIKVRNILIDDDASIIQWVGKTKIGYFGDSWASAGNDITRFLNIKNAEIHSISEPGFSSLRCLLRYPYVVGKKTIKDINFDIVVISFGVNDACNKVLRYNLFFKIILKILINKIKISNPDSYFFFIQSPRNYLAKIDYSKYGDILKKIASKNRKYIYISSSNIEKKLKWQKDGAHLDIKSKHLYGEWLGDNLNKYLQLNSYLEYKSS